MYPPLDIPYPWNWLLPPWREMQSLNSRSSAIWILSVPLWMICLQDPQLPLLDFAGYTRILQKLIQQIISITHPSYHFKSFSNNFLSSFAIILFQMNDAGTRSQILSSIRFIQAKQRQMQRIRLDLNHQITFNLKDAYLSISNNHSSISIRQLSQFLSIGQPNPALEKFVKWNNHCSSLNLTFAQFSAVIITKEDRLLAKMVLERQEMGAIPNYLLEKIRRIVQKEIEIHQFCMRCEANGQEVREWIEGVIDENGDLSSVALEEFLESEESVSGTSRSEDQINLFLRFLQSSGNITAERLLFLWQSNYNHTIQDISSKLQKLSTNLSSPKSLLASQSYRNLRPQFYDCLNRPVGVEMAEVRESKSIKKHINRINSMSNLRILQHSQSNYIKRQKMVLAFLSLVKEIIQIERQTQNCRIQLRLCPDFYPILFFQSIPKDRNKNVTPTIFKDYLQSFGYYTNINEVYFLFRRYSAESKLTFNSFCSIFDPVEKEFNLLEKNRFVESLQDIDFLAKRLYFTLILTIMRNEVKINRIKLEYMKKCKDIFEGVSFLFQSFGNGDDSLTQHQLKNLFQHYTKLSLPLTDIRLFLKRCERNPNAQILRKPNLLKEMVPYITKEVRK